MFPDREQSVVWSRADSIKRVDADEVDGDGMKNSLDVECGAVSSCARVGTYGGHGLRRRAGYTGGPAHDREPSLGLPRGCRNL